MERRERETEREGKGRRWRRGGEEEGRDSVTREKESRPCLRRRDCVGGGKQRVWSGWK